MQQLLASDVFIFPSERESYGLPLVEALAAGVPILCSDIEPFRELAGDAAVYFRRDTGSLQRAVEMVAPQSVRAAMAERGATRVVPNTGWDVFSEGTP